MPTREVTTFSFTLVLGTGPLTDSLLDRLFEAGCDDATFAEIDGVLLADFDREATDAANAITSAIADAESAGLTVRSVEPDDHVTASQIAARLGRSRESVRLLIAGERGPGSFPPPVTSIRSRSPRWRWRDVEAWLQDHGFPEASHDDLAAAIAGVNAALELRRADAHLSPTARRAIRSLAAKHG